MAIGDTILKYGTATQSIPITLVSLANSTTLATGYRQSTSVDTSGNGFIDAIVDFAFKLADATLASDGVYLWIYASQDGTTFTYPCTGTDGVFTSPTSNILRLLGVIPTAEASSTVQYRDQFSIVRALGYMPPEWGIVVQNKTGRAFSATEGDMLHVYRGIYANTAAS